MPSAITEPLCLVRFPPEVPADLQLEGRGGGGIGCHASSLSLSFVRCSQKFQRICSSDEEEDEENEVLDGGPVL